MEAKKRKKPTPISAKAMKDLKEMGMERQVVEQMIRMPFKPPFRRDLFGCIDIIACKPGVGVIGIQVCAGGDHAKRMAKAKAEPRILSWLESGGRFEVWSYAKRGDRGRRKLWTLRREELKASDIVGSERAA